MGHSKKRIHTYKHIHELTVVLYVAGAGGSDKSLCLWHAETGMNWDMRRYSTVTARSHCARMCTK